MKTYIAVIGDGRGSDAENQKAYEVGVRLAEATAVLVCGGLGGVMEAACRGAKSKGGTTVGILPGGRRAEANPYVDVAITTGLGEARNALVVRSADGVVAVGGGYGTLSEIGFALKIGKPVVGLDTWKPLKGDGTPAADLFVSETPQEAVEKILSLAAKG